MVFNTSKNRKGTCLKCYDVQILWCVKQFSVSSLKVNVQEPDDVNYNLFYIKIFRKIKGREFYLTKFYGSSKTFCHKIK